MKLLKNITLVTVVIVGSLYAYLSYENLNYFKETYQSECKEEILFHYSPIVYQIATGMIKPDTHGRYDTYSMQQDEDSYDFYINLATLVQEKGINSTVHLINGGC